MPKCFCCKKEYAPELLQTDACGNELKDYRFNIVSRDRVFCPVCRELTIECGVCSKEYVCSFYIEESDEYVYTSYVLDNEKLKAGDSDLLYHIQSLYPYGYIEHDKMNIERCSLCNKIICFDCYIAYAEDFENNNIYYCLNCIDTSLPELKSSSLDSRNVNTYNKYSVFDGLVKFRNFGECFINSLLKEREEKRKMQKKISELETALFKAVTPLPDDIVSGVGEYL